MDNESEVIQRQMEETRSSLQDKLETLEQQVKNTVQDATHAVSDTVESVKDAVQETVDTVKDTVQGTVQSVRESFDFSQHIQTHPWTMFFGATALGFVATRWLTREAMPAQPQVGAPNESLNPAVQHNSGQARGISSQATAPNETSSGVGSWIADHYKDELAKVKGLAVGALGGVVRDMLINLAPPTLTDKVKEVANDFTAKMGGQVFDRPILQNFNSTEAAEMRTDFRDRPADVDRPLGAVCE